MSEEQVLPQDEENYEEAATYWIDMLTPKTAANYRAAAIQCDGNYRRANDELRTALASLAQSEAERERLRKDFSYATAVVGRKMIEILDLRSDLARERELHQGLREVVKEYRESHTRINMCKVMDGDDLTCRICIKADALLADKSKPVATTS